MRVFIVEPYEAIRESLAEFVKMLGHEAVVAFEPVSCPHYRAANQHCSRQFPCGDAFIIGQSFPSLKGLELIERRIQGGCKARVANVALICEPWSDKATQRARELGFRVFETPLHLEELTAWLQGVAATIPPDRQCAPLTKD